MPVCPGCRSRERVKAIKKDADPANPEDYFCDACVARLSALPALPATGEASEAQPKRGRRRDRDGLSEPDPPAPPPPPPQPPPQPAPEGPLSNGEAEPGGGGAVPPPPPARGSSDRVPDVRAAAESHWDRTGHTSTVDASHHVPEYAECTECDWTAERLEEPPEPAAAPGGTVPVQIGGRVFEAALPRPTGRRPKRGRKKKGGGGDE